MKIDLSPQAWTANETTQPGTFRSLLMGIGVVAGLTHAAFCGLFFWAGVTSLAYVNIASVLCYAWVYRLARRGAMARAWTVTATEVIGHAILAVSQVGWDTGFQFYILLVIPVGVINPISSPGLKGVKVLGVMLTYLVLDIVFRHQPPPERLSQVVEDGLHYFNVMGSMIILTFLAGYYYYLINKTTQALHDMASTDPLTQLKNRRAIMEAIRREVNRARRDRPYPSFILGDLDHFKTINDTRGHDVGDMVLRTVSKCLADAMRDVDLLARWGGEEFLAVLPDTDTARAVLVAERLRGQIESLLFDSALRGFKVSMTFGVATLLPNETAEQAITRADAALYDGKRSGRNRVLVAPTNM